MDKNRFADVHGDFTISAVDNTGYGIVFYDGSIAVANAFGSVLAEFDADDIPAADVAPVVHGEWIRELICNENGGCVGAKMICSHCKQDNKHDEYMTYCPNCGAKMCKDVSIKPAFYK